MNSFKQWIKISIFFIVVLKFFPNFILIKGPINQKIGLDPQVNFLTKVKPTSKMELSFFTSLISLNLSLNCFHHIHLVNSWVIPYKSLLLLLVHYNNGDEWEHPNEHPRCKETVFWSSNRLSSMFVCLHLSQTLSTSIQLGLSS